MVFRNKRGGIVTGLSTLSEIIILLIATGLFLGVFSLATSKVDEKTSENLCRSFNILRFKTEIPTINQNVVPRACKTIDKKDDIPTDQYKKTGTAEEATSAEIRDMMTKCWWMWLEGKELNVFDKGPLEGQQKCFICYTFSIAKNVPEITYQNFVKTLFKSYYGVDRTDRCAPTGRGGMCCSQCGETCRIESEQKLGSDIPPGSEYFTKEVSSNECEEDQKCCITDDNRDECKDKGGRCLSEPNDEYNTVYPKWQCKSGTCYLKEGDVASYIDYLQGTGGVDTGAGAVIFTDNENFHYGKKYAVTFLSPGRNWDWRTVATLFGTAGTGIIPAALRRAGVIGDNFLIDLATFLPSQTGKIEDSNLVMVSTYDRVKDVCAVQASVGED